ncbi:Coenzyme F420 hydrogenase/dehydrogenase, beta subunit C-terminal domain [Pseudomonadota bacterium]
MHDDEQNGLRPTFVKDLETSSSLSVCPGYRLERPRQKFQHNIEYDFGPVQRVWEGYASDPEIRKAGSSGGAITALSTFGLEVKGFKGILHIGKSDLDPIKNQTKFNNTRSQLLANTGSRYSPASPCDGLDQIENADGPCIFIGKPCDVAAVYKAKHQSNRLDQNLGLTIAFFCAGTPSTEGTRKFLECLGVGGRQHLADLDYRGSGWPGDFKAVFQNGKAIDSVKAPYAKTWGFLTKYKQWRCKICIDHVGEFADVSVGDPWYLTPDGNPGLSLVVARTARGLAFVEEAMQSNYMTLKGVDISKLPAAQPSLVEARSAVWGRLFALKTLLLPVPKYKNMNGLRSWLYNLTTQEKFRSIFGTHKRIILNLQSFQLIADRLILIKNKANYWKIYVKAVSRRVAMRIRTRSVFEAISNQKKWFKKNQDRL